MAQLKAAPIQFSQISLNGYQSICQPRISVEFLEMRVGQPQPIDDRARTAEQDIELILTISGIAKAASKLALHPAIELFVMNNTGIQSLVGIINCRFFTTSLDEATSTSQTGRTWTMKHHQAYAIQVS